MGPSREESAARAKRLQGESQLSHFNFSRQNYADVSEGSWQTDPCVNETGQAISAYMFLPELGNEVVPGTIALDRTGLHFNSELYHEEIPASHLLTEWDESDDKIFFKDTTRLELNIYTLDQSVLEHPVLPQLMELRQKVGDARGRSQLTRSLRITLWFLAACILVTCLGSWATSLMVRSLVARVPPEWERNFGRAQLEELQGEMVPGNYSNQLAQLSAPLLRVLPPGQAVTSFFLVDDPEPNACALPGGSVVVNTGLLTLTDRPEELLGVIAHELAHVTQKHLARKIVSGGGALMVCSIFLHSRDSLLNALGQGSGFMVFQSFSKEYETEADDVGWQYLVAANIDPRGMASVFRKLKAYEDAQKHGRELPRAFQSHPALEKRIARLEAKWKKLSRPGGFLALTNAIPVVRPEDAPASQAGKKPSR